MTAALQDPTTARRRSLILKYREAWRRFAMPWLSEEVFGLTADIGTFNREHADVAITGEELQSK